MNENNVKRNSPKAWLLAIRPKTLSAAVIPVAVACAMAYADGGFKLFPAVVCMIFAALMQIASNLINDIYDFMHGSDREDRLGPKRATAQGWISPTAMRVGIVFVVTLACLCGCLLVREAGMWLVFLGGACVLFAFLYTTLFSYIGLGDLLVLAFFGIVPVTATYYLQTSEINISIIICAVACGMVTDTLLVLNNYRDRDTDRQSGKRTIIVMFGEKFGQQLYLFLGIAACVLSLSLAFFGKYAAAVVPLFYLVPHVATWKTMVTINHGRELNKVLALTSRNILLYGLYLAIGLWLS